MPLRFRAVRRFLIGRPLRTAEAAEERLGIFQALAILSSDALSSVAYATEEILRVLVLAGAAGLGLALPVGFAIAVLIAVVSLSYRQTVRAYPGGGGAYVVAKENLGTGAALVAAAALLVDYVLTASVSITAGTAAVTSAVPALHRHRVAMAVAVILAVVWANLRGVRAAGALFTLPTYGFVATVGGLVVAGLARLSAGGPAVAPPGSGPGEGLVPLTAFLVLRAFSSGCTALTGIEAISNGVTVFRPPEARNAARTMAIMAALLVSLFLGVTFLSHAYGIVPREEETVVSQLARLVFGPGPLYYATQAATALILVLAANTSYADFPRLAALLARDGYLPRQLAHLGERLVYSGGIALLGLVSALMVVLFHGSTHALIPLYAVGVFISFTLSQSGMVVHWWRERGRGWLAHALVNGTGAAATALVLAVVAATKFVAGAWLVLVLVPLLVRMFLKVRRHYELFAEEMQLGGGPVELDGKPVDRWHNTVVIPVAGLNRALAATVAFARTMSDDLRAVHVALDAEAAKELERRWRVHYPDVPLTVLPSPYRSVIGPLVRFIHAIERRERDHVLTVVLPEFVVARWWQHLLHNQTTLFIKAALLFEPGVVVVSVPFHLRR